MSTVSRVLPWRRSSAPASVELAPLLAAFREHHPKSTTALITQAYELAASAHTGQTRRTGEPYIHHPLSVAQIVADFGLDDVTIAAALLHDSVEDTGVDLEVQVYPGASLFKASTSRCSPVGSAPTWPASSTASPSSTGCSSTPSRPNRRPPCARCWWRWPRTCGSS
ncbi:MAG TPA: HD domain-containing protein [Acidimicrobiales bacterium]|nr:HD domain-containing protein [Acidimicrobiales bacterium]